MTNKSIGQMPKSMEKKQRENQVYNKEDYTLEKIFLNKIGDKFHQSKHQTC
jgi:hypothetical protein